MIIRNDNIEDEFVVAPIIEKMVETQLKWLEHGEKILVHFVVKWVVNPLEAYKDIKKTIKDTFKNDIEISELDIDMTYDITTFDICSHPTLSGINFGRCCICKNE